MEFVHVEGEEIPRVMYKPYVYKHIIDCSNHCFIYCQNGKVDIQKFNNEKEIKINGKNRNIKSK